MTTPSNMKRNVATGPVLVGLTNANIIACLSHNQSSRVALPATRKLAKMIYEGQDFLDIYTFEREEEPT